MLSNDAFDWYAPYYVLKLVNLIDSVKSAELSRFDYNTVY